MKFLLSLLIFLLTVTPVTSFYEDDPDEDDPDPIIPAKAVMIIELNDDPDPQNDNFTRHLVFKNYDKNKITVDFNFTRKSHLLYEAIVDESDETIEELEELQKLRTEGNRSYWDEMRLENRGGITTLPIKHLFLQITYNRVTSSCENDIIIIDYDINSTLGGTDSDFPMKIPLNNFAQFSRLNWVQEKVKDIIDIDYIYTANTSPSFLAAVRDIGKCGTAVDDEYGVHSDDEDVFANPKYGPEEENLCSEFVSWYYANEGTAVGKKIFHKKHYTIHLMNEFEDKARLYSYNGTTKRFEHTVTGDVYYPQPGDFLARVKEKEHGKKSTHSMMIAGWNDAEDKKRAAVINGTNPVTLRKVKVQDHVEDGYEYYIGRINEFNMPTFAEWTLYSSFEIGDKITYQGTVYTCIQSHTAHSPDWNPGPYTQALWQLY